MKFVPLVNREIDVFNRTILLGMYHVPNPDAWR
jgi:hypothetical protein